MFFVAALGRSPNSGYFGLREGVSSKSWSTHREGSARDNLLLCAGEDRSQAPCWPLAGKSDTGGGFPPGGSQCWQLKAPCVIINILKPTGLNKTVFSESPCGVIKSRFICNKIYHCQDCAWHKPKMCWIHLWAKSILGENQHRATIRRESSWFPGDNGLTQNFPIPDLLWKGLKLNNFHIFSLFFFFIFIFSFLLSSFQWVEGKISLEENDCTNPPFLIISQERLSIFFISSVLLDGHSREWPW